MRRLALGLAGVWMVIAFGFRLHDMRRPQVYISALTGGQRQQQATLAWIEGSLHHHGDHSHGRLVVSDIRLDGKIERFASARLPAEWPGGWIECRLWLEEAPEAIQAVAKCPGQSPVRLTAVGTHIAGLGPDNKSATLYDVYPVTAIEPERIVSAIHRHDLAPRHPLLLLLGLCALLPLGISAWRELRKALRLGDQPLVEGVMEHSDTGMLTIRDGDRRVAVFVEQGEVLSVGLTPGAIQDSDAMAVSGLRAAVQGDVERTAAGAFRGQETMRLRRGAMLVVGDALKEARRRVFLSAAREAGLLALGASVASAVAMGLAF